MERGISGIDLFSGAGGLSLGADSVGVKVELAIELDRESAMTYQENFPVTKIFNGDLRNFDKKSFSRPQGPLVLFGGPPCQGFSSSNRRTRSTTNKNNWLFLDFLDFVAFYHPDWVLLENVHGFRELGRGEFCDQLLSRLRKLGYSTEVLVVNASDFGVPQFRRRLFILGSLKPRGTRQGLKKFCNATTTWQAIGDLPILENGNSIDEMNYQSEPLSEYATLLRMGQTTCRNNLVTKSSDLVIERYVHVRQGHNWNDIPASLMQNYQDRNRCHSGIYFRLEAEKPSVVLGNFRKNMLIHPYQNRGISVREAARLQSFPDSFVFKGTLGSQQQQVGNAVPPLLGKEVFEYLLN